MVHDWGSAYAFLLMKKYPGVASAVVAMDVAAIDWINIGRHATFGNYGKLRSYGMAYQYSHIFLWTLFQVPGLSSLLQKKSPINFLNAYSYWYVHADHLIHAFMRVFGLRWLRDWQTSPLSGPFPPCPTLYVYGTAKSFHFHSDDFVQELHNRKDGSDVLAMDAGHWVMTSTNFAELFPTAPEKVKSTILKPGNADLFHQKADDFLANLQQRGVIGKPGDSEQ
mmetsp:Transcript_17843/g.28092  ORF Transcript_17843/g.28092 Transcript_17843/m.28092 type:complete len:223 (-) Transcript_17843:50-718(-)